MIESSF